MDLLRHIESRDQFLTKISNAAEKIRSISALLNETFKPAAGPYLLYNHVLAGYQRCNELRVIVDRLYTNRVLLLKSDLVCDLARPRDHLAGIPYPSAFHELSKEGDELNKQITLDFQTMLIFTGIALDDWAHIAGYVLGVPSPTKSSFDRIAKDDGKGPYAYLWQSHKESILWLDAIPRLYRNKMIVHREQPWQMGNSRSSVLLDWSFWTPISVGWVSEQRSKQALEKLSTLAISIGISPEDHIQSVIMQLLRGGARLTPEQRKEVYSAATDFGFQTPSFQEFAHQLADFFNEATDSLKSSIINNSASVDLGQAPHRADNTEVL